VGLAKEATLVRERIRNKRLWQQEVAIWEVGFLGPDSIFEGIAASGRDPLRL